MEQIAEHYKIPSINFVIDVIDLKVNGNLIFKGERGRDAIAEKIFSYDGTHPTLDYGYKIYTKTFIRSMLYISRMKAKNSQVETILPLDLNNYEKAKEIRISEFPRSSGWKEVTDSSYVYKDYLGSSRVFPKLLYSSDPNDFFKVTFKGKVAGLFDVIGPSSAGHTVEINGSEKISQRRFNVYYGSFFRSNYALLPEIKEATYTLRFRPDSTKFDKKSIYSKKPVKIKDTTLFNKYSTYVESVLIIGDLIKND